MIASASVASPPETMFPTDYQLCAPATPCAFASRAVHEQQKSEGSAEVFVANVFHDAALDVFNDTLIVCCRVLGYITFERT